MDNSKKAEGLLSLLEGGTDLDNTVIYERTLGFLIEQGFEEDSNINFKNEINKLYILTNLNDVSHTDKSYAFLLRSDIKDYKFAINRKEGWEGIAYGLLTGDEIRGHKSHDETIEIQKNFRKLSDEDYIRVFSGLGTINALVKIMRIRSSITEVEAKGLYDTSEYYTSQVLSDIFKDLDC